MKLKKKEREPFLRNALAKDTPKFDVGDEVKLQIELKKLDRPPKKDWEKIIVPN